MYIYKYNMYLLCLWMYTVLCVCIYIYIYIYHTYISLSFKGVVGGVKTEIFHFREGLPPTHLEIFHLPKVKYFS